MTYLPCLLTPWSEPLHWQWTPLVVWHTKETPWTHWSDQYVQGLLHVGLHCNKLWSAGPVPGDQQHRAWLRAWPPGGADMCLSGQSPNSETPYYCLRATVSYLQKLRVVSNRDQNTPLTRLLGLKTTPFPHRNCEKHTLEGGTPPVHNA